MANRFNDDTIVTTTKITASEYVCSVISLSEHFILKNVFMNVPKGSIYGLIGPSGCGKTTLLKCIMGIHNYNGQVILFGRKAINLNPKMIGYMPQSSSLYNDLTSLETLVFFARISLITNPWSEINHLLNILEIPKHLLVSELSGGQTRRLSLAIAIIHRPKLLLLDEPTVGIDPMLREQIWQLFKSYITEDNSIIITTHYIEEAIRADNVSFLRNGYILIEDKPKNLIEYYKVKTLDEVFHHLCNQQLNSLQAKKNYQYDIPNIDEPKIRSSFSNDIKNWYTQFEAISHFQLLQISRQPENFIVLFVIPILIIIIFCVCIGGTPSNLKLAIVNNDQCECRSQNISSSPSCICASKLLINSLNSYIYNKVNYSDYEFAKNDVAKGKLWGVLYIPQKFTSSVLKFDSKDYEHSPAIINADLINELLKRTVYRLIFQINRELSSNFSNFSLFKIPIKLGQPIFGTNSFLFTDVRDHILPGILILINYTASFALMALTYQLEKQHERTRFRLIGLSSMQILLGHVITRFIWSSISALCLLIISVYILEIPCRGSFIAAYFLILSQVIYGIVMGTMISLFSKNIVACSILGNGLLIITFLLSGVIWPVEGLPYFLKWVTFMQPTTLVINGIRNIMIKSLSTWDITVLSGYFVTYIWIVLIFILQIKIFKFFKFE